MEKRRSTGTQLLFSRIVASSILTIGILALQTEAKPQSGHDRLGEVQDEYSSSERSESFQRNTSTSFHDTIFSSRKRVTRAIQDRYTRTPGVGIHVIHNFARTWDEARSICQNEGGDLAIINSIAESQALTELMARSHPHIGSYSSNYVLLGFNDKVQEGNYVTIDGRSLPAAGFAQWAKTQPDNMWGIENCGSMFKDGRLNDVPCNYKYAFACELPLRNEVPPAGPVGPQGIPGVRGNPGIPGPAGRVGAKGEPGERGTNGLQGVAGVKGSSGDTGPPGLQGLKGAKGNQGIVGPRGPLGAVGPPGLNGAKGSNGWNGEAGLQGPPGLTGPKGEPGEMGTDGRQGEKGEKGLEGDAGPPGPQGSTGQAGPGGDRGSVGPSGPSGPEGAKGEPGVPGAPGLKGDPGEIGAPGPQGANGIGETGPSGAPGPRGEPGLGYDDACLAVLSSLGRRRGFSLIDGGGVSAFFGDSVPEKQCKEFVVKAYKRISEASHFPNPEQPDGRKESPSKTCKDLFFAYPDKPSGEYWMDPNGGDVSDAILVRCDAEKRTTCVTPKSSRSSNISYTGDEQELWLSEIENGMQITYTAASDQINALQLLSSHAEQTVTYHCLKSVGYFDAEGRTYERGLKLLTWNDVELQPIGNRLFRYDVMSDECRDRLNEWKATVIVYRTDKPIRLPVTNVALRDVGKSDQSSAVEIGEACFR